MTEDRDNQRERQDAIRDEIARLIGELTRLRNADDDPILIGWAVSYEWTSVGLEQADRFAAGTITPREQAGSTTRGLFELGTDHMTMRGDDE